jgi:hypothetical protein
MLGPIEAFDRESCARKEKAFLGPQSKPKCRQKLVFLSSHPSKRLSVIMLLNLLCCASGGVESDWEITVGQG